MARLLAGDPDRAATRRWRRRSRRARPGYRIAIVSDFLGDAEALLRASHERIIGGGEVDAVHVVAREELDPPRRR